MCEISGITWHHSFLPGIYPCIWRFPKSWGTANYQCVWWIFIQNIQLLRYPHDFGNFHHPPMCDLIAGLFSIRRRRWGASLNPLLQRSAGIPGIRKGHIGYPCWWSDGKHSTMPVWLKGNGFRNTSSFLKIYFASINLQLWHCSPKSWKTMFFMTKLSNFI